MIKGILDTYFDNELDKVLNYSISEKGIFVEFINTTIDLGRRNLVTRHTRTYDVDNSVYIDARNYDGMSKNIDISHDLTRPRLVEHITREQYLELREYLIKKLKS